jgi:uncharacterized protein with PQ loop repeat
MARTSAAVAKVSTRAWSTPPTYAVMLGAVVGVGIGVGFLFFDWSSWGRPPRKLVHADSFVLWASLICAQTTLWTLAAVPVVATLRRHRKGWAGHRFEIVISGLLLVGVIVAIVVVSTWLHNIPTVFPRSRMKVRALTGVALLLSLTAAVAIWLIRGRLVELREGAGKKQVERYIEFRSDLERLLAILGAIVGLAVLATAALREVVLEYAAHGHPNADFPADYPILYGLILSLVLALIYLPTYLALLEAGADLRNRGAPLPDPNDPDFAAAIGKRQTLTGLLGLDVSASTSFRAGVAILSPLFAALLSLLPKLGG